MPHVSTIPSANTRNLKRSFIAVALSPSSPERTEPAKTSNLSRRKASQQVGRISVHFYGGDRFHAASGMTAAAGSKMLDNHVPSFMSMYSIDSTPVEDNRKSHAHILQKCFQADSNGRNDKRTTGMNPETHADQASPTLSPTSTLPPASHNEPAFRTDHLKVIQVTMNSPRPSLSEERSLSSPNLRKKNPKSLALNLSPKSEGFNISEPSSPSFIKPPALKERRKPSLLSLNTGAANKLLYDSMASPGMPSMLHRRSLKHSVSTPQILATPGFAPPGGMALRSSFASRYKDPSPALDTVIDYRTNTQSDDVPQTGIQMATRVPGSCVGGDTFDRPHSGEDAKSPSYPDGPILMHEPHVYLYSEPNREEAMQFDVVINVAREVKCPFKSDEVIPRRISSLSPTDASTRPTRPDTGSSTKPHLEPPKASHDVPMINSQPAPLGLPHSKNKNLYPEYIHVPWDHNTDVMDELWELCSLIEGKSKEGKRVLVHCQQGASRSATLIIAYGMFVNHKLGPNESYQLAQSKSRWINPNMSLLFSLNDFKKMIDGRESDKPWKPPIKHRTALSTDIRDSVELIEHLGLSLTVSCET